MGLSAWVSGTSHGMSDFATRRGTWSMAHVVEDLHQIADTEAARERDGELRELAQAAYSDIDLAARLHASCGAASVGLRLLGGVTMSSALGRVGADFVVLQEPGKQWAVLLDAVASVSGLSDAALDPGARPLGAKVSVRSVLRQLAERGESCVLLLRDGALVEAAPRRVGADFIDAFAPDRGSTMALRLGALAAVRCA